MIRSAVILIILTILIVGCLAKMDSDGYYLIEPVDDPSMLPYRFIVKRKRTSIGSSGSPMLKQYVPVDLYGDGTTGMYSIGNNWRRADSLTAVLFYADTEEKNILSQLNIKTTRIASHFPYDFDGDNVIEVAVAYTTRDTLWLEIIDPHQRNICRFPLKVGQDRDGNGFWDGAGAFCGVCDFNNDGYVELLVNCKASFDLYPRKLMCVDWFNKEIRWEYNISGVVIRWHTFIEPSGPTGERFIIFGVKSLGNAAVAGDMNDQHSYLIVLDEHGNLQWKQETGEVFSHSLPVLIDYNSDGNSDILAPFRYDMAHDDTGSQAEHGGGFRIYTADGNLLDSINLGAGRVITGTHLFDLDSDGKQEVFVSLADASILIYDQSLKPVRQARFYSAARVWDYRDFLGNGESQLLVATMDNKLWLLDKGFKPLAQFGEGEDLHYRKSAVCKAREPQGGFDLIVAGNAGQVNYFIGLVKSPWNTVFFRYPLLAFLTALLPMSLVVALIWFNWHRTRKQKRIISQQRDRLNTALEDLKAAQEKLIAIEEYNKTQDALQESENRYKTLVENLPQRIFLKDKDSIYVSCNQHYARDLRIKPDEIAGKTDYDFHPKELAEKYRADDKRIVESGKTEDIEERYIQNGRDVWVHTVKTPIKDEKGNIVGVLGIFRDITERKQAEEALREKERRYALATSAAKVGVWDWDMRSGSFYLDPNVKALLGYEDSEIPNDIEVWTQYIHPDDKDAVMQAASDHLEGRTPAYVFEHRMLHKDGTVRWFMVRGTAVRDAGGNAVRMVGTDTDITERKQAGEALRESEEKYRDLTEKMVDVIYTLDTEGSVTSVNEAIKTVLGFQPKEVIGRKFTALIPKKERPEAMAAFQRILNGERLTRETVLVDKNGELHNVEFSSSPIIKCKKTIGTRGIVRDITERKRIDAREKARLQLLNDLRTARNIDACLEHGCKAIYEAGLFKRAVLTLHNNKREIINLGQVGLDEGVVQAARNAPAPDEELSKSMTQEEYRISHSYFIPEEAALGLKGTARYISQTDSIEREDSSWKTDDELFVPIIGDDDKSEGWLSVDTPFNGERPNIEIVRFLEQVVDIVTQKVREIRTLEKLRQEHKALQESEERYRALFERSAEGILVADIETLQFKYANPAICSMLGYNEEELKRMSVVDIHPQDALEHVLSEFEAQARGEKTLASNIPCLRKDGSTVYADIRSTKVLIDGRERNVGFFSDITDRKRAEEALLESEERFRNVSASAQDAILMMDNEGRISFWNEAAERVFGYQAEEILGKSLHETLGAERFHDAYRKGFGQFRETGEGIVVGQTLELAAVRKDGTEFPIELSVSAIKLKGKWNAVGILRDITERKQAEEELRSERDFVRSLLDTANSLIVCLDNQARITVFNNECEKVTGYTREEVIGKSWPEIFLPEDHHHHRLKDFAEWVRQHPRDMYEGQLKTKSGQFRTILWSNSALFPSDSDELTAIAVGQDITERKKAERQLQVANQKRYNQVKEIAGGVSHEIFNALFPATSCLNKLSQRLDLNRADELARNRKLIQVVENAVQRAVEMTELVTEYSKLESDRKIEDVSLQAILQEILLANESRIEELKVKVKLEVSGDFFLKCHRPHIYSLFNNLMVNALDAIAEVKQRNISISACKKGSRLSIEFSDSGAGIPPENIDKIFDAFFSTKPRTGTGLGLAISKKIVELYSGSIEVNSSLDKGTKFIILL